MGTVACKRRRASAADEAEAEAPLSSYSGPTFVSDHERKLCFNEACNTSECSTADDSKEVHASGCGGSWIFAVEHGDLEALTRAEIDSRDCGNADRAALQASAAAGWTLGVQCLLGRRADPRAADSQGHTALHEAAKLGRCDVLRPLLEAVADINAQDRDMDNDDEIFRGGHYEKRMANRTALHYAAEGLHPCACKLLVGRGANVEVRDSWYKTPLHLAEDELASEQQLAIVDLLLLNRADPNLGNMERGPNQTSLMSAVHQKNFPLVKLLIKRGADVHARGKQGMCALHLAARTRSERLVVTLLDGRADPAQRTRTARGGGGGSTAADLARSNNCPQLAALIENHSRSEVVAAAAAKVSSGSEGGGTTLMDELS